MGDLSLVICDCALLIAVKFRRFDQCSRDGLEEKGPLARDLEFFQEEVVTRVVEFLLGVFLCLKPVLLVCQPQGAEPFFFFFGLEPWFVGVERAPCLI